MSFNEQNKADRLARSIADCGLRIADFRERDFGRDA